MIQDLVHKKIIANKDKISKWFRSKREGRAFPFYTSVDVRDSSQKVVIVDANIFPAGFNNICATDKDNVPEIVKYYLDTHYGSEFKKLILLTEEHTGNSFYWENVNTLQTLITAAGREVRVAVPRQFDEPVEVQAASGAKVLVHSAKREGDRVSAGAGFVPDLIISNNDFSDAYEEWSAGLSVPINPPRELGWFQRKKSDHFEFYNQLAGEFADLIGVDRWVFQVKTERFAAFDISDDDSLAKLADKVDEMLKSIADEYKKRGLTETPFVFIKNNSGTYGMGVTSVKSGDEVRGWNSKTRKKMKVSKGSRTVEEVIIQEGVPSIVKSGTDTAEPTIYIVGCDLVGGFLRSHHEKGPDESLNSPGAVYKRLCVSDLKVNVEGSPMENVYGWVARLSSLAIGLEGERLGIKYDKFKKFSC
ncbi:MAG TPA: glutamate--cysteine ligase [Bdellovibrionales bacterium]|nr:glutamate--cysteine ligase [Bdellovibrionales bacterium]